MPYRAYLYGTCFDKAYAKLIYAIKCEGEEIYRMELRHPIPTLEANLFLKNRVNGFTTEKFYQSIKVRYPKNEYEYNHIFELLMELDERLSMSITLSEEELGLLYLPLSLRSSNEACVAQDSLSDILIPNARYYDCNNDAEVFRAIRENSGEIPSRIAFAICPEEEHPSKISAAELISVINSSDWPQASKLILIEMGINPEKYISLLERAVLPVAHEFTASFETWEPLERVLQGDYNSEESIEQQLRQRFGNIVPECKNYSIIPTVTGFQRVFFYGTAKDDGCVAVVGVLYNTLTRISKLESNAEAELSRIMSVLGDPSRFNIIVYLAKQKSYGRELAKLLNITPGAISQHISILMSTGLIESDNIGNRVYYSLNDAKMQHFIKLLQSTFPKKDSN